ncbi:concanavalin A-like lectin/glucanase domain-containing protein [Mycena floridula]|nr:concanavalin A-like lectin/glucanase domain-containing protein [Mycena floridula]
MIVRRWLVIFFFFSALLVNNAFNCDCGFIDPLDPSGRLWTSFFETNFTLLTWEELNREYRIMQNPISKGERATREFTPNNVFINQTGVHLTVSPATSEGDVIPSGGIYTKNYFGFGSYHFLAQTSTVSGTVQAFYNYKSDDNEVDIELTDPSNLQQTFKYSVKPQQYSVTGTPLPTTLLEYVPNFDVGEGFHTHSFIWDASSVAFGLDDVWSSPITTNVPTNPGVISMSHWSDGNEKFSGGPPTVDSTMTIQRLWVFYNTTESSVTLACQNSRTPCSYGENSGSRLRVSLTTILGVFLVGFNLVL